MLNHIVIMGRLVRDPELRRTGSGVAVTSFTLAVDRDFGKNENGEKETDFIDCIAWRQTGEFVSKYFSKGRMAVASGRLQIRNWTDKDGNKRRSAEVAADNVYFGDSKNGSAQGEPSSTEQLYESMKNGTFGTDSDFTMLQGDDDALPF
jgi:single-strand DNA-binding protein